MSNIQLTRITAAIVLAVATASSFAASAFDVHEYERTIARDDRDQPRDASRARLRGRGAATTPDVRVQTIGRADLHASTERADRDQGIGIAAPVNAFAHGIWTAGDQDDLDAAKLYADTEPAMLCQQGKTSSRFPNTAAACVIAHDNAVLGSDYERAMLYAALGCERHASAASCRHVSTVPLLMGNQGMQVPARMGEVMKRVAQTTCAARTPLRDVLGTDVRARECLHLVSRFLLAQDETYRYALEPAARTFFEAIYDPQRASGMQAAACQRWSVAATCSYTGKALASTSLNRAHMSR